MARKSYVQINGKLYERGVDEIPDVQRLGTGKAMGVLPDGGDFVSPIDGKVYSGRAGMREHCARHDVVPTADLAGLPLKPAVQQYVPDRAAIREALKRQFYR